MLKSEIGLMRLKPKAAFLLEALGKNPFLIFSSFWKLLAFLGVWPRHSNFSSHCHISFSDSDSLPPSCKNPWTHLIILGNLPLSRSLI